MYFPDHDNPALGSYIGHHLYEKDHLHKGVYASFVSEFGLLLDNSKKNMYFSVISDFSFQRNLEDLDLYSEKNLGLRSFFGILFWKLAH